MASMPAQRVERPPVAENLKRYLRRTNVSHEALKQPWVRAVARHLLRATRHVWSTHGGRVEADLRIKKYAVHRSRSIFAPIPKVGTRSIEIIFARLLSERDDVEPCLDPLEALRAGPLAEYRVYSIVRNPWSRVLSVYQDKVRQAHKLGNLAILSRYPELRPDMGFEDFVGWLAGPEGRDEAADRHWLSQHVILATALEQPDGAARIGRFERFEHDLARIMQQMGLALSAVPKRNVTAGAPDAYRDYYSGRSRALVAQRYSRDIELFGYQF